MRPAPPPRLKPSGSTPRTSTQGASDRDRLRAVKASLQTHEDTLPLDQQEIGCQSEGPPADVPARAAIEEVVRRSGEPDRRVAVDGEAANPSSEADDLADVLRIDSAAKLADQQSEAGFVCRGQTAARPIRERDEPAGGMRAEVHMIRRAEVRGDGDAVRDRSARRPERGASPEIQSLAGALRRWRETRRALDRRSAQAKKVEQGVSDVRNCRGRGRGQEQNQCRRDQGEMPSPGWHRDSARGPTGQPLRDPRSEVRRRRELELPARLDQLVLEINHDPPRSLSQAAPARARAWTSPFRAAYPSQPPSLPHSAP